MVLACQIGVFVDQRLAHPCGVFLIDAEDYRLLEAVAAFLQKLRDLSRDQLGAIVQYQRAVEVPDVVDAILDPPLDVSDVALAAGQGMDGNIFVFTDYGLQFNLKAKNFEAAGTYTITMISGNGAEYLVAPTCTAQFVIE